MIDSYFGLIGNSFYAGPNGASFSIRQVWPNRVAMDDDLNESVMSSRVQIGDYVVISYGDKNTLEYMTNKEIDADAYEGRYYNATLWQKVYEDSQVNYKNLVTFSSAEPDISLILDTQGITADTIPSITLDTYHSTSLDQRYIARLPKSWDIQEGTVLAVNPNESLDISINGWATEDHSLAEDHNIKFVHFKIPKAWNIGLVDPSATTLPPSQLPNVVISNDSTTKYLQFQLPEAWDIGLGPNSLVPVNPNVPPSVSISYDATNPDVQRSDSSEVKYLYFKIPKPWDFKIGKLSQFVNPGENPSVKLSYEEDSIVRVEPNVNDTTQYLHFSIPRAWDIALGKITFALPNTDPVVTLNTTDTQGQTSLTTKYVHFTLPVSQSFQGVTVDWLSPLATASASLNYASDDEIHRYPTIALRLPAAIKTLYGPALFRTDDYTVKPNADVADYNAIKDLKVGDYYINTTLAAVHQIDSININNGNITTRYIGSMQLPIPNIISNPINPYDANGNPIQPTITKSTSTSPVSSWDITVDTIKAPSFDISDDSGFIASTAKGKIVNQVANGTILLTYQIPRGTRITTFARVADRNTIQDTLDGDIYINSNGIMSVYSGSGDIGWVDGGSLKGDSIYVKNSAAINITEAQLEPYSGSFYQKIGSYLEANYSSLTSTYKPNEIINISYEVDTDVWVSHWLFKASDNNYATWTGSQLTGDASNSIIITNWQNEIDDSKAYSVSLINQLRTTISNLQTQITALQVEVDKGWGIMADNGLVPYTPEE